MFRKPSTEHTSLSIVFSDYLPELTSQDEMPLQTGRRHQSNVQIVFVCIAIKLSWNGIAHVRYSSCLHYFLESVQICGDLGSGKFSNQSKRGHPELSQRGFHQLSNLRFPG